MAKILVVEDDESTVLFLKPELEHEGFETVVAMDGRVALEKFESEKPDLILLDVMLPELNGIEVLRRIRKTSNVPVLLVTARNETIDKVSGLNTGADDYISKPFEIDELLARVNAVLRRVEKASSTFELKNGEIELSIKNMSALVNGNEVQLSKTEFLILKLFLEHQGEVLSRQRIIDEVWGKDHVMDVNGIDVYLTFLRNKVGKFTETEYFKNQRGIGFIMVKQ